MAPRGAGLIGPGGPTASGAGSNVPSQLNISRSDRSISMLEFLVPRRTNLQFKQHPPLTPIENIIDPQAPKQDPVIGGVILHVRPAVDTTPPSQIPSQDPANRWHPKCSNIVLPFSENPSQS